MLGKKKNFGTKAEQCYHSLLFLPFLLPTLDSALSSMSFLITRCETWWGRRGNEGKKEG